MRFTKYIILAVLAIVATLRVSAQTENQIIVNDVQMTANSEKVLTVNMNNKDDIVAVELSLRVPNGFSIDPDFITLSDRAQNHQVTARKIDGNRYSIVIVSPDNKPFNGTSGTLLSMTLKAGAVSDGEYSLTLLDAIMAISSGKNVIDSAIDGTVTIGESRSPDYVVQNIQTTDSNVMPNDILHLSWQVKNEGNIDGTVGWSEYVYLLSDNGDTICISKKYCNATILVPGAYISRNAVIELPKEVGIDGKVDIAITIVPDLGSGEIEEYQANNTTRTQNAPLQVGKCLYLSIPSYEFVEGEIQSVFCKLSRSGSWSSDEEFKLELQPEDSRLSIPKSVTIHRGEAAAYFYLTINNNDLRDACSGFKVRVEGNEYEPIEETLTIYDDEMPIIHVNASVSEVTEGETFQLIITANGPAEEPMKLMITSEKSWRFNFPATVEIPAGETKVIVDVKAIDNNEIDISEGVAFSVTTPWHSESECIVILNDNDMPTLSFTLAPESVSEDGGPAALIGVIRRTDNFDKRITLKLSDDSNGLLSYAKNTIVMEKGKQEVQFNVGVVDNDSVDGNHTVNVQAVVYSASCNCSIDDNGAGVLNASITIIDNDGPALKIKPASSSILEGSQGNVFTISHNIPAEKDVRVTISSDKDDILEYDHEIIIPAGSSTADLLVNVKNNDTSDDSNIVTFKVQADGYAMGSCWIVIADQTLPDATISLRLEKDTVETEETIGLTAIVKNLGNTPLNSRTPVEITYSGSKETVQLIVGKRLSPGDSVAIEYNYYLPIATGLQTFEATVNGSATVEELLFSNNSSGKVPVMVLPSYSATAQVEKDSYGQGDSIIIIGNAIGSKGRNAKVEVYLINNNSRQTISATTDDEGHFVAVYKPLASQMGRYIVGACYPNQGLTSEMDAFEIVGLSTEKTFSTCEFMKDETYRGTIVLTNPCAINQTGITVTPKATSQNCDFSFNPSKLVVESGKSIDITFAINGNQISEGSHWQLMPIEISTNEGAKVNYIIHYKVHPQTPPTARVQADKDSIKTTMTLGMPREYPLNIRNVGREETGKITFALPSWIETATPREMASISPGDEATVILRFIPFEEMKLNVPVNGYFGINCENGDGTSVRFSITPVSETKGKLIVDVVDEFTFNTDIAPHVEEATIKIMNPATMDVVAEGLTDDDGLFSAELPEGNYTVSIEADHHKNYEGNVMVSPGQENKEEVFLSYDAITYEWNVVETKVDDEYEVETIAKFETRVPKPIVTIKFPRQRPEPYSIIPVTLTNHGLVNAVDVSTWFSVSKGYRLEPLNETWLDTLRAHQSYVIYVKLIPSREEEHLTKAWKAPESNDNDCLSMGADGRAYYDCDKYKGGDSIHDKVSWGCPSTVLTSYGGASVGPGQPSGGGTIGNNNYGYGYSIPSVTSDPSRFCDKGPHNVDEYGPIDREIVPSDAVPETDCNEEPKLVFKLVPVSGTRYDMLGVAADGISQVKIVLDPEQSHIPSKDCDDFEGFTWKLSRKDFGKIEPISEWEAIYTAPDFFPSEGGRIETVYALLRYKKKDPDWPLGHDKEGPAVKIEISRPPVVFIHGFGASRAIWHRAEHYLTEIKELYKKRYNCRVDYKETNVRSYNDNIGFVADGIQEAQRRAITHGYMATKCDLVGHSTGGILARLFVERGGRQEDVNRIITLNTPHAGAEYADMIMAHKKLLKPVAEKIAKNFLKQSNIGVLEDMCVESDATSRLVNVVGHYDIPVYALGTQSALRDPLILYGGNAFNALNSILLGVDIVGLVLDPEPVSKAALGVIAACLVVSAALNEGQHLIEDDYSQIGEGDLLVSNESQIGGCRAGKIITNGPWHASSPKDYENVIPKLTELLSSSPNSPMFSTDWFAPKQRHFYHVDGEVWIKRGINLIPVVGSGLAVVEGFVFEISEIIRILSHVQGKEVNKVSSASMEERVVNVDLTLPEELTKVFACVKLNDNLAHFLLGDETEYVIPATFAGKVSVLVLVKDAEGNLYYDEKEIYVDEPLAKPVSIEADEVFINAGKSTPLDLICTWDDGSETNVLPDQVVFEKNGIASFSDGRVKGLKMGLTNAVVSYGGVTCHTVIRVFSANPKENEEEDAEGMCSTVTLSFKQKNVMSRQAFRGTLTINNGSLKNSISNLKLNLEVRDSEGKLATSREFQIDAESLDGFEGQLALDAGWTLAADSKGTATILFIPTKYAAPTKPVDYSFGGSFSYVDPSTGLTVTRQLNPVTLTVNPSPDLEMTYFMQRDVYGDDPMTEEVESSIPAEFALLINNKGYGEAKNMNLTMNQPQIIDNQKGLAVNFEIISSQVNGGEQSLALSNSITSDFGDIPAQSQSYIQWWLNSSLLGHFIDYDVKATHMTSRDNPNLSLIDTVTIHELVHGFAVATDAEVPLRGFLVNDIADIEDCPDEVYFTDATHQGVSKVSKASITQLSDTEYVLSVTPSATGWNYGVLPDPTQGRQKLISITRKSDNTVLPADNVWQTSYTMKDGKNAVRENRVHFVFEMLGAGETFTLAFEPVPDVELQVIRIEGGPEGDMVLNEQLKQLSLAFNKPIEEESFTTDDITLTHQGIRQDVSQIGISPLNGSEYILLLESLTKQSGYYVLTIHTSGIKDTEGFSGVESKQYAWEQAISGLGIDGTTVSHELKYKVYPIPIKEKMRISGNFGQIRKLTIYDIKGIRMLEVQNVSPDESIDVSMLRPGEYILTIHTDMGIGRIKITKA